MSQIPKRSEEAQKARRIEIHKRLQHDFMFYAPRVLKIATKAGDILPFKPNRAQQYIHHRLSEQINQIGMVRATILKGRQQGCSTYTAGRFYHRTSTHPNMRAYILSHEAASTSNLFGMVDLFHEHTPPQLQPKTQINNQRQMAFENGSQYTVGTAGSKTTGRSQTNQLFHGSEVAFYENTGDIETGVLQTIADLPGTEIILESTANGVGNFFYNKVMEGLSRKGRYQTIFVPWFWQEEYRTAAPPDWRPTDEELHIKSLYELTTEQLYWRYLKIIELKSDWKFKQEYPCTPAEAFQSSGTALVPAILVQAARKRDLPARVGEPLVIGVDAAREGDRTVIVHRSASRVPRHWVYYTMDEMQLVGILVDQIRRFDPDQVFIDVASAHGAIDRLNELGYASVITPVHFGQKATKSDVYMNKRAEMAGEMQDWFLTDRISIPDDDEFALDIQAIPDFKYTSRNLKQLEAKDKIKETFGKSPDIFDALALTFAYPVNPSKLRTLERQLRGDTTNPWWKDPTSKSPGVLKSTSRLRQRTRRRR